MTSNIVGAAEVVQRIKRARIQMVEAATSSDLQKLLLSRIRARFEAGVDAENVPWPGLFSSTIERKQRSGSPTPEKPLQDKGRLLAALQILHGSNEGTLAINTGLGVRIGIDDRARADRKGGLSPAEYGRIHNYGEGVAQRQFIGLGALDARSVSTYLRRRMKLISQG